MSDVLTPDICVVGAGAAGLTVAAAAAAFGVSVVLIEKHRMGGDCLNTACVPSKALLAAARRVKDIRDARHFGVMTGEPEVDFAAVQAHVRRVIAAIEPNDSAERFTGLGVAVIRGTATFTDKRTIVVGATEIRARRFVLATGSRPAVPPIANLDTVPYLTNETIFDLQRRPGHLIVIGAGPVGLELAQAFRRLGAEVTVLEAGRALSRDDPELTALLLENLRGEGIAIREGAAVARVVRRGRGGVRATLAPGNAGVHIDGTHLLIATGRRPDLAALALPKAGIAFDEQGIRVNARLRTSNRRVYAIGDAVGGPQFTHWASYQAGLVVRSILFRFGGKAQSGILPWATYTDPELAHVGLTEAEAFRRHRGVQVLRWPLSENDRAQAEGSTRGLVKVLASRRGRILGVDILGHNAGELIAPWAIAIAAGTNLSTFASAVLPYPTFSEAGKRAAISFYAPKLRSRPVKWALRLARLFG
ncbi:MAG TPA: FAD-dependent oxidoreductase [Propylenella sp.]|nr:FAD-dependent oxidoreductase [Propylenella sp.]